MSIKALYELVQDDINAVNHLIVSTSQSSASHVNKIVSYVTKSEGKRIRPLVVLLASRACGYEGKEHIKLATMVEIFHTATLLHDDVIDESVLRRGRKTVNQIWGSKASILVGDYLFAKCLQLLVDVGDINIIELLVGIAPQMGSGELQELSNRHQTELSMEDYFNNIHAKTALLFAASASMGALICKSSFKNQKSLYAFGLHLGNAFQLLDDSLDYCSSSEVMGKNIGADLVAGKVTLPLLYAIKNTSPDYQLIIKNSIEQGSIEHLPEILKIIKETKAIEYTQDIAKQEVKQALLSLNTLPGSVYKDGLVELSQYVISRTH